MENARLVRNQLYQGEGNVALRVFRLLLVLGVAGLSAGCMGILGGGSSGPEFSSSVVVRNDFDPPTHFTIDLRKAGGDTKTLGSIAPGDERAMTYSSKDLQGTYQLIARQSSGAAVMSREFTLFADARVEWQVRGNVLTVNQPR